ncbi:MAG: hypothetical protein OQJ98_02620 [Candidatus Pacebacteria bacterium]|nr:hypothetical protein [Candidatus Paceibacterota bacterium]
MKDKGRIESLRKQLYSRKKSEAKEVGRRSLRPGEERTPRAWKETPIERKMRPSKKRQSPLKVFFIFSIIFFLGSTLFGAIYFFGGKNLISSENVDIEIQGPTAIGGGEELSLQITITNKNPTTLEAADLLVEYPEGARAPENMERELSRYRESLGDIAPGDRVKKTVRAVFFGEENTQQRIKVTVEYRTAGSNAIFYSEKEYEVTLSSAPVSISVRSLGEVTSGQEFSFSIAVNANVSEGVEDIVVVAEYPFGFTLTSAQPRPAFSNSVWDIGDLRPGEERIIDISGTIVGQENDKRTFRFDVGVGDELDVKKLATTFVSVAREVTIQRPFIGTIITLNNEDDTAYVFEGGERVVGSIAWKNNLPDTVSNVQIEARLIGEAVDESTVFGERGFYNSVTDTIRWGRDTLEDFALVNPSEAGILRFGFSGKNIAAYAIENPEILLEVTVRGTRVSETGDTETITSRVSRNIRFSSDLALAGQVLRTTGPFVNTGPIPPVAEQESTYTIVWTVTNTANHVSGAQVTATLPSYVRWLGNISPQGSGLTFNENARTLTWNIGEVAQGVGVGISPKEVAFQVGLTPSVSQVGQAPVLIEAQGVSGFDQFTDARIFNEIPSLSIRIFSESSLPSGHDRVIQ